MTKQEWVIETIAEHITSCINEFKETRPYTLHSLVTKYAKATASSLHSQGVVLRVDRELPHCDNLGSMGVLSRECPLLKAGYAAVESLIKEE